MMKYSEALGSDVSSHPFNSMFGISGRLQNKNDGSVKRNDHEWN